MKRLNVIAGELGRIWLRQRENLSTKVTPTGLIKRASKKLNINEAELRKAVYNYVGKKNWYGTVNPDKIKINMDEVT